MTKQLQGQASMKWANLTREEQEAVIAHHQASAGKEVPKAAKSGKGSFQLRGYVRCELAAADKESFLTWEGSVDGVAMYDGLVKLCDSGYLLKLGESKDGFQASLCAASTGASWDGYVLTAFAGAADRALRLLVYKHEVLMQGDWSLWVEEGGEDFFR